MYNGYIAALATDIDGCDKSGIPLVEYFGGKPIISLDYIDKLDALTVSEKGGQTRCSLLASAC